ncbi:MAG: 2-isopropylmalate synthase [Actinomycetaceae bacterium]|nr:2-isopropylmalate synthase [Actinomycetaceae bacterium]
MKTTGKAPVQQPSGMPISKYRSFSQVNPLSLPDRTWPDKVITKAPRWLSTDLRDGNQALIEPMDPARKRRMFNLLVDMGFKEIEVGFPSASQTDFDFVRSLIETDGVPDDVCVSVLTQAREDLIERTIESLKGFKRANVHIYNATAPVFREVVFRNNWKQTVELAQDGVRSVMAWAEKILEDNTIFGLQYSPEIFIDTEIDRSVEICDAVIDIWQPDDEREIIINLPATIERSTPNIYADQVEYMSRNISHREHVCLSLHCHNDRGCAVAASELGMQAGADRVEGCLFGQGERTGNVDLVTLGMNLFSQGIDPMIDFSDIDKVRQVAEYCNQMPVPPRQPYSGELVYTSFSGSHQDAIKKGFAKRAKDVKDAGGDENAVVWQLPYLPIDPHDVGRTYEAVVRVNSQSGKGGIAYLMLHDHNLDLPRRLQIEFSRIVQNYTDSFGGEVDSKTLGKIFTDEYLPTHEQDGMGLTPWGRFRLFNSGDRTEAATDTVHMWADVEDKGEPQRWESTGNGPIDAFVHALNERDVDVRVLDYTEHAMSQGRDAKAAAYVEAVVNGQVLWGVGIDRSITRATYKAVISAVNRALRDDQA